MNVMEIGDIVYVPLDREDGLVLRDSFNSRNKFIVIIGFTPEGTALGSLLERSGRVVSRLVADDRERIFEFLKETDVFDNVTKRRFGLI